MNWLGWEVLLLSKSATNKHSANTKLSDLHNTRCERLHYYITGLTAVLNHCNNDNLGSGTLKWPAISIEKVVG